MSETGGSQMPDINHSSRAGASDADQTSSGKSWLSSSVLIAAFSAISALLGTGIGAALQGYWNTQLERQKFESALISRALETSDKSDAAKNLLFLVNAGLIQGFDANKIRDLANNPSQLPVTGSAVRRAKTILKAQGLYQGPIDDNYDAAFSQAVKDFQKSVGLEPDGIVGPQILFELLNRYQK
jgi:murein L,D-transpeptidase YcbB/YkuD